MLRTFDLNRTKERVKRCSQTANSREENAPTLAATYRSIILGSRLFRIVFRRSVCIETKD